MTYSIEIITTETGIYAVGSIADLDIEVRSDYVDGRESLDPVEAAQKALAALMTAENDYYFNNAPEM